MQLSVVLLCSLAYVLLLFLTAWWVDRRVKKGYNLVRHPYVYSLSLAVYCTAWTYYGSVGRASVAGLSFLAIYLGPSLMAPLWFVLLRKMVVISKNQRITSIADFISSRYGKSASLAALVTLISVLGIVPYISIQLKAVSFGVNVLTGNQYGYFRPDAPFYADGVFWIAVAMSVFTLMFGTRKLDPNERHEGLVAAVAFESLVKLFAFLCIGYFVVFVLYDGFGDLFAQAAAQADTRKLFSLQASGVTAMNWNMLTLLSALAILLLPRQFHIAVVENTHPRHIATAMWMFPLYLLLINIFVLPIALAGKIQFGASINPDTYVLTLPLAAGHNSLALLAYLGGFSAATSMIIVSSTALSIMISNHLAIPVLLRMGQIGEESRFSAAGRLLSIRRIGILLVMVLSYLYLKNVGARYDLVSVGLISFTAVAQFAPAALGGMYWKRATHQGAMAGLLAGFVIWIYTLPLPSIANAGYLDKHFLTEGLGRLHWLKPNALFGLEGLDPISHAAFWSLLLNTLLYAIVSVNTQPSTLTLTQADLFVNISKYTSGQDYEFVKRQAALKDLEAVLGRFMGTERTLQLFAKYQSTVGPFPENQRMAPADFINFAETHLAGAIGAASARLVIDSIAKEEPITLEEIMQVLEQTQEVMRYSKALEATTRQLTAANDQLKNLDRLKADFITTVTHELRTPLTSIKSLAKILLDYRAELPEEKTESYLRILVSESERISRLINQVLDLEKLQNDPDTGAQFQPVDLAEVVHGVVQGMEQLLKEKKVQCNLAVNGPSPLVSGNRDRLVQVVVNLLSNALKFVPANTGIIDISLQQQEKLVILQVKDNGIGISPARQAMIFEKFTQLSNRETGKPEGSGLGLFITKTIVQQHKGQIRVLSEAGQGAIFEVKLPRLDTGTPAPGKKK